MTHIALSRLIYPHETVQFNSIRFKVLFNLHINIIHSLMNLKKKKKKKNIVKGNSELNVVNSSLR